MSRMSLTGVGRGAPSWLLRDPDTGGLPALDIDYAGGRAFKGSVVDLAGLHTVSRASGGYAQNLDGPRRACVRGEWVHVLIQPNKG